MVLISTHRHVESDHRGISIPLRKYHKGPHQVVSSSCAHHLYVIQCDKDFISALQVEDPTQEIVPYILHT